MVVRVAVLLFVALVATRATTPAQSDDAFDRALEPRAFAFPADHGSHPAYRTEWWYFTGVLETESGERIGYQATWFRSALVPRRPDRASRLGIRDLYFFHGALTRPRESLHVHEHSVSRAGAGWAGAVSGRLKVHVLDHVVEDRPDGTWHLRMKVKGRRFDLRLRATRPPLLHGASPGLSVKGPEPGQASYYVSLTRLETTGTVQLEPGGPAERVTGRTWFDHEFGSALLAEDHEGWDWFSVALDDGTDLMVYAIRKRDGSLEPNSSGTLRTADGRRRHLPRAAFTIETLDRWTSPHSRASYPARWRLTLPGESVDLTVTPAVADQELRTPGTTGVTYWEGLCTFEGTVAGRPVRGSGYVELVGYSGPFRAGI
jgi:predicted secreted hydrolase